LCLALTRILLRAGRRSRRTSIPAQDWAGTRSRHSFAAECTYSERALFV
jgi:hypothetical protein